MDSFILEDVKSLLKLKKGDSARLNHIKELSEANEIISLSDRKYIERLSSQYLRKFEKVESKKQDKPKFIPIEESPSLSQTEIEPEKSNDLTFQLEEVETLEKKTDHSFTKNLDFLSNRKIIYSLGTIVLAIVLIAVIAVGYDGIQIDWNSQNNLPPSAPGSSLPFTLESDKSSYETSDIVSISGKIISPVAETVRVSIENEQGNVIWAENLDLKNDGEFSTLSIAGGAGWENSGEYILIAEHEDLTEQISFIFDALK